MNDMLLLTKTVKAKNLAPGGVLSVKGKATVPSPSQGKFIIADIDATDLVTELDEGNNITTAQPIP
jgi:hypothetical protein